MRRSRGFTLLEVLVALAILALSAAAVLRQTQLSIRQQEQLELKSYALGIADDTLAALLAQTQWPAPGRTQSTRSYRGQQWQIATEVQPAPDQQLRRIEVSVALLSGDGREQPLLKLTTYRGEF